MNTPVNTDEPLNNFSDCHAGIVKRLTALDELPALLEPAAKARQIAEESLEFFREAIFEHIDDLEDYYLAEARARKNRNTISLEDVERELGLAN